MTNKKQPLKNFSRHVEKFMEKLVEGFNIR